MMETNTHLITRLTRRLAHLLGLGALLMSQPASAVFFTPGQFGVSPTGAANYSIPIVLPPGTAGMAPSLAITYSSQSGNGLLGVGVSLSGLSAITRCPQTKVQDNYPESVLYKPIQYNATDKYCLDGQRLVAVNGVYGANGTEYRTERESFSRIISYGSSGGGTGVGHFKVWTKSGLIMEYGNSTDSLIEQQGKTTVQVWAQNKVSDTVGNDYTVTYQNNGAAHGEFYPLRIDYTGNARAELLPYNSVRFEYEARPDAPVLYDRTGSRMQSTQRLSHIKTWARVNNVDTLVKDYQLAYQLSAATQRSRLVSVIECSGDGSCLLGTSFGWDAGEAAMGNNQNKATAPEVNSGPWFSGGNGWAHRNTGDFDGNGKTDLLIQWSDVPTARMKCVGLSALATYSCEWMAAISLGPDKAIADFNADGYEDVLSAGKLCLGPELAVCSLSAASTGWGGVNYVANINGDQYPDLILYSSGNRRVVSDSYGEAWYEFFRGYCLGPTLEVCNSISLGRELVEVGPPGLPPSTSNVSVGDFNVDGKTDLIYAKASGGTYFCSGEEVGQNAVCTLMNNNLWGDNFWFHSGDFNGDGIVDLYLLGVSNSYFCPGPGIASGNNCQLVANVSGLGYRVLPADYNGDGVTDLFLVGATASSFCAGPGITTGNNCVSKVTGSWLSYDIRPGDYDGDGVTDLLLIADSARYFAKLNAGTPDRLVSIVNGLGAETRITYKPLTDATVYAKGTGANVKGPDYLELQAPMYVVSSVSASNGIGGQATTEYYYWRARSHKAGGGFMGFEVVRTCDTNVTPNICTQTWYTQDYPQQGLPSKVVKFVRNGTNTPYLNLVQNTWVFATDPALGVSYRVPQLRQSQEVSYELANQGTTQGPAITNVTTTNSYDAYGNPTLITVNANHPGAPLAVSSKATENTYVNDTGTNPDGSPRWILGRLRAARVTSTTP